MFVPLCLLLPPLCYGCDTHISIMMPIANRPRDVSYYSLKVTIPTTSAWCASTISIKQKMGEARGHAGRPAIACHDEHFMCHVPCACAPPVPCCLISPLIKRFCHNFPLASSKRKVVTHLCFTITMAIAERTVLHSALYKIDIKLP